MMQGNTTPDISRVLVLAVKEFGDAVEKKGKIYIYIYIYISLSLFLLLLL